MNTIIKLVAPVLVAATVSQFSFAKSVASAKNADVLFNDGETFELRENPRFKIIEDVVKTFKVPRDCEGSVAFAADEKVIMVSIAIITDTKTGKVYHENTTFRHIDDGDNTRGWIEEVNDAATQDSGNEDEGRVVATIGDSFLNACK